MKPLQARKSTASSEKRAGSPSDAALAELDGILKKLRALFLMEFERGGAHAASRILHLVSTDNTDLNVKLAESKPLTRAPRGAAKQLVEKALADGAKSIGEIRATAATDVEKILSYQTVRLELERGRAVKKYKKVKDKWSLS